MYPLFSLSMWQMQPIQPIRGRFRLVIHLALLLYFHCWAAVFGYEQSFCDDRARFGGWREGRVG